MNRARLTLALVVSLWSVLPPLQAQFTPVRDTLIRTCSGTFTDSGGPFAPYGAGERYTATFCPEPAGNALRLAFSMLALGAGDTLYIYDGADRSAPLLARLGPGNYRDSLFFQATVENASGCLSVFFQSDGADQGAGWNAAIACGPACQRIAINLDSIGGARLLPEAPVLGACLGTTFYVGVSGVYPQNGIQYAQSDISTRFTWKVNNSPTARTGPEFSYRLDSAGALFITLEAADIRGCRFSFPLPPVQIAPNAMVRNSSDPVPICLGDTIRLNGSRGLDDPQKSVSVLPGMVSLPDGSMLSPAITSLRWRFQPGMIFQLQDSIAAIPDTAGLASFVLIAQDTFGCTTEGLVSIEVLPAASPACPGCIAAPAPLGSREICPGDSIAVNAAVTLDADSIYSFKTNPQYRLGFANHPHPNPYAAILPVSAVPLPALTNPRQQIAQVCINIRTDWAEDLDIFLRAPSGELLELSTGNGGGFDDYQHTCFTPTATTPITAGDAPFTGFFQPEGNWDVLQGAQVNGEWALLVSDGFDSLQLGRVESWNITFVAQNQVRYQWSPAEGLSCTDCPDPLIRPAGASAYVLEIEDARGCVITDTLRVSVIDSLPAPLIACGFDENGQVRFSWDPVAGIDTFETQLIINGRDSFLFLPAAQGVFAPLVQLRVNDTLQLRMTGLPRPGTLFCGARTGQTSCIYTGCSIQGRLVEQGDVTCFGGSNGFVVVEGLTGSGGFEFQLNGTGPFTANPRFEGLSAGQYVILVRDQASCTDSIFFTLREPLPVRDTLRILQQVSCAGGSDGIVEAVASGGTGALQYSWNTGRQTARLEGVTAGTYTLTITDSLGCSISDSLVLVNPPALALSLARRTVSCTGLADGLATVLATGGTGALRYAWNTGAVTDTIRNLAPGTYCVTVSDSLGCTISECVDVTEPPALQIDSTRITPVTCVGARNGEAIVYVSGGVRPYQYLWSDPFAQVGLMATMLESGPVQVRIRDANGCTLIRDLLIPAPEPITLAISAQAPACRGGADGAIRVTVRGGTGTIRYLWNNGRTDQDLSGLVAGTYTLTVTDANGCQATAQTVLTEPAALLNLSIVQTERGCFGTKQNAARISASGGTGTSYSYRWENGATTPEIRNLDSLRYAVTVTDAGGCARDTFIKLTDLPDMDPNMIASLPACFNGSDGVLGINFILGRPGADLAQYRFTWSTGASGTSINGLRGDMTYTVTVTDPQGCTAVASRFLRQPRPLRPVLAADPVSCFGGSDGRVRISSIEADSRNFTFQWNIPGNQPDPRNITGLPAGAYRVTVTDEFNCTGEAETTITQPTALGIQFVLTNNRCSGDQTGAIQVFGNGGTPPYQFAWQDGAQGNERRNLAAGTYRVTLTDARGCQSSSQATLQSSNPLRVSVETRPVTCNGGRDGVILITQAGGRPPYQYSVDGRNFRPSPTFIGLRAGNYDVVVQDANGCQTTERAFIPEPREFKVDAGPENVFIKLGDTLTLSAKSEGAQGPVLFSWTADFPGTLSCTECDSTIVLTQNTISYVLIGVDSAGCEATDRVTVHVRKDRDILVPTGFTPNDDGNNDVLIVHGLSGTRIIRFLVFDRWGEQLYERRDFVVNDPSVGWDGTFRGKPLNPGVYVWYLEAEYIDGFKEIKRGQTTLIR